MRHAIENRCQVRNIGDMERSLEQMARSLIESGDYRIISRLEPQAEYHPPDNNPTLVAAVVDVETTGTNSDRDRIIELGSASSNKTVRTGGSTRFSVPGSGSKIPAFRFRLRSRKLPELPELPELPMRWSLVTELTIAPSTTC